MSKYYIFKLDFVCTCVYMIGALWSMIMIHISLFKGLGDLYLSIYLFPSKSLLACLLCFALLTFFSYQPNFFPHSLSLSLCTKMASPTSESCLPRTDDVVFGYQGSDKCKETQVLEMVSALGATLFEDSQALEDYSENERLRSLIQSLEAEINNNPCTTSTMELEYLMDHHHDSGNELCTAAIVGSIMDGQQYCWSSSTPNDHDLDDLEWIDSEHMAASLPHDDMNWLVDPCEDNIGIRMISMNVDQIVGVNICEDSQMYCGDTFRGSNLWQETMY